ncbi:discoidin domain-containing protein [Mucilaginibacter sp. cycad4]|uniref:discoidin domain-containing protein n=1 Tax=Mucilaginibacter sp. cycad4 TaxID=3342096 RepID=UPI002AAA9EF8|nr:discoidin domain-containing protein [Mucilaginibacter gossypii]WPV00704.1 discoidin domain-containing protein [Mucilaginibacter gossypii]
MGNESGLSGDPCWSTINPVSIKEEAAHIPQLNHGEVDGTAYVPAEVDVSIRPSWFYHQEEDAHVKSVAALWDLYFNSVGHNSVLLLNFPPDKRGLIPAIDSVRADSLHRLINGTFKNNLAAGASIKSLHPRGGNYKPANMIDDSESTYYATSDNAVTDTITFNLGRKKTFDVLMLQEVIELGHRTTGWSVDYSSDGKKWMPIPEATEKQAIGYKWFVKFKPVTASKVRLKVTSGKACLAIHTFDIYKQPSLQ